MKRAGRYIAIAFLGLTALNALWNGASEIGRVDTALQRSVEVADLVWGALALATAVGLWRRRNWAFPTAVGWAVSTVYAATVASFSFSDPTFSQDGTLTGTIAAGVSTTVVTGLIAWYVRVQTRAPTAAPAPPA